MKSKYKNLIKNSTAIAIANFSTKFFSFLLIPIYTHTLKTEEFGFYDLIITSISFLFPIFTFNIVDSVMLFLLNKTDDNKKIFRIGQKYCFIGIFLSILFLFLLKFFNYSKINNFLIYILLYYVFISFNQLFIMAARGLDKIQDVCIASFISVLTTLLVNVYLLVICKAGMVSLFISAIISNIFSSTFLFFKLNFYKLFNFNKVDKILENRMMAYGLPLIVVSLSWIINDSVDKYMVTYFIGLEACGILAIAYKVPHILNIFQSIFIQAWQISAITEYKSDDKVEYYTKMFYITTIFMTIIAGILIIISQIIAKILFINDFYIAYKYTSFLLISSMLNCAGGFLGPILSANYNSKSLAISAIFGIITNIVFNYILINKLGIQGATIATAISSLTIYTLRRLYVAKFLNHTYDYKVYTSWALLVLIAFFHIFINNYMLEIATLFAIIIINYKIIILIMNTIYDFITIKVKYFIN